jgi:drug/metabolite transporter (DMT)-like permease
LMLRAEARGAPPVRRRGALSHTVPSGLPDWTAYGWGAMRRMLTWAGGAAGAIGVALMLAGLNQPEGGSPLGFVLVIVAAILLVAAGAAPKEDP